MQHTDSSPDYYKILGVRKDATQEEIKRAYVLRGILCKRCRNYRTW